MILDTASVRTSNKQFECLYLERGGFGEFFEFDHGFTRSQSAGVFRARAEFPKKGVEAVNRESFGSAPGLLFLLG